jgi:hypothetical protein
MLDVCHVEQRRPQVRGEDADPAGTRWEGREDRGTQGAHPFL